MPARPRVPLTAAAYPALVAGVTLFVALVVHQGVREVGMALAGAGGGLVVVALFHLVPMLGDALGWRALLRPAERPPLPTIVFARWIGESVNALLPVLQLGGNVVKAQMLARHRVPRASAGASVVVDVTLVVITQVVFTLGGVFLLLSHFEVVRLATAALAGAGIMAAAVAAFVVAQRRGAFGLLAGLASRLGRRSDGLGAAAAAMDAAVLALWRRPRAILGAAAWHLASWLVGAGEVWLALRFLGHPVDIRTAVLLESLGQAVRTGGFAVPGALGVQEGGFLVLGAALGLGPETALALSLTRRVRDLLLGLPGLVVWQLESTTGRMRAAHRARSGG